MGAESRARFHRSPLRPQTRRARLLKNRAGGSGHRGGVGEADGRLHFGHAEDPLLVGSHSLRADQRRTVRA